MRKILQKLTILVALIFALTFNLNAQTCEWRLGNVVYNSTDPDAGGPATGSVAFTLQIHTVSGSIPNINVLATGWSYQSASAMIPTSPGCAVVSNPANVTVSPAFVTGGFAYTTVNQCGTFSQTVGGKIYDKRAVGTLDGTGITLTTTWTDVLTVTLWTLGASNPQGGFAMINSGSGGSPNTFTTYSVSDDVGTEFPVNSLTTSTPISLGNIVAPVLFSKFVANCNDKGTSLEWVTTQEINTDKFQIEKSFDGVNWKTLTTVKAAGNSSTTKAYQQLDLNSGAAFYRIKQFDLDGKFTYTNVEATNCTPKNVDVVIYPVPTQNILNIAVSANKNVNTQFIIYDATGKVVKQLNEKITIGNNFMQLDVNSLPNGQYILRSTDEYTNINKKFTILK